MKSNYKMIKIFNAKNFKIQFLNPLIYTTFITYILIIFLKFNFFFIFIKYLILIT